MTVETTFRRSHETNPFASISISECRTRRGVCLSVCALSVASPTIYIFNTQNNSIQYEAMVLYFILLRKAFIFAFLALAFCFEFLQIVTSIFSFCRDLYFSFFKQTKLKKYLLIRYNNTIFSPY